MKVLVCGGRTFGHYSQQQYGEDATQAAERESRMAERRFVNDTLTRISNERGPITEVIEGGAKGADTCAFWWTVVHKVKCTTVKADWKNNGTKAGPIRNSEMLKLKPDMVVAFPGGTGTADMVQKAKRAGVEVIEVQYNAEDHR